MRFNSKLMSTIVKVGTIVEEATKMSKNRSDNSSEEERKEAEEKVVWIFQKCFSTFPQVARYARTGRQFSWNNTTLWGARALRSDHSARNNK